MELAVKKSAKTAIKVALLKSPVTWIILLIALLISALIGLLVFVSISIGGDDSLDSELGGTDAGGTLPVAAEVLRYEPLISKYAEQYGVGKYTSLIMALIQQESGGTELDVMQASESLGLPPGSITDPEYSIQVGVKAFADVLKKSKGDITLALQSYNFGSGFIDYALSHGGYSRELAVSFSKMMAARKGWDRYGDVNYAEHVLRYYNGGGTLGAGSGVQKFDVKKVLGIMTPYLGRPYVWGGRTPAAGGFDCSGLLEYAFHLIGINLTGNAASQYKKTIPVPDDEAKPGDIVFFSTYKPGPSHVGMYLGKDTFINANNSKGTSYSSVEQWKKLYPYLGFRRIP